MLLHILWTISIIKIIVNLFNEGEVSLLLGASPAGPYILLKTYLYIVAYALTFVIEKNENAENDYR